MSAKDTTDELEKLLKNKIFPRNLTARADFSVKGNPVSSRPESAVGNCFPGLDFDDRNLDKTFFPGLVFEFHRPDGAILYDLQSNRLPPQQIDINHNDLFLRDEAKPKEHRLFLWGIFGLMGSSASNGNNAEFVSCSGLEGRRVWTQVRDLRPGRIVIIIGPRPGSDAPEYRVNTPLSNIFGGLPTGFTEDSTLGDLLRRLYNSGGSTILRDNSADRVLQLAFLSAEREIYIDADGVLDVDSYPPGELTRTMCCPWQYDYRDCGCFYWAGSKPDVVAGSQTNEKGEPKYPYLNYVRAINTRKMDPPPQDNHDNYYRRDREITHGEMFDAWNDILPAVLNDRESEEFEPPFAPVPNKLMTRKQVIEELKYLAKVEHALCVEYLYAHYSLNAPKELPKTGVDPNTRNIYIAANQVFSIAIEEMRHLRWVNEALIALGESISLDRAVIIGRQQKRPFALERLTPEQLDWFIKVEEPSQSINEGVDGMYVSVLESIDNQPNEFPEREQLIDLIKFIIDEGGDHYKRFVLIKEQLNNIEPSIYLRELNEPEKESHKALQNLSDENYRLILGTLMEVFSLNDDRNAGILLKGAVKAMFNLHDTNHILASQGIRPSFNLPSALPQLPQDKGASLSHIDEMSASINKALSIVDNTNTEEMIELTKKQRKIFEGLFDLMHRLVEKE